MAKINSLWLRRSTQKLGGVVLFPGKGGQTLARELVTPSNPRTEAQMQQRTKLGNLVAMYRANRAWMERYAFEGRPKNWSVFNAFVSYNIADNEVQLSKDEIKAGVCIAAPYQMTRGSLPSIEVETITAGEAYAANIYVGEGVDSSNTVAEIAASIIANNNGIQWGDQISFIQNLQVDGENGSYVIVRAMEVILDENDTDIWSEKTGGLIEIAQVGGADKQRLYYESENVEGFCFILSRQSGSEVRVSSQRLILTDTFAVDQAKEPAARRAAIESYGALASAAFLGAGYQSQIQGQGGGGTDPDVPVELSILGAAFAPAAVIAEEIPAGTYTAPNGQIGTPADADAGTDGQLVIKLSGTPTTVGNLTVTFSDNSTFVRDNTASEIITNGVTYEWSTEMPSAQRTIKVKQITVVVNGISTPANFSTGIEE